MSGGGFGRLLRVNLTTGATTEETIDPGMERDYIGGVGLATRLIYDELSPGANALGPDNKLIFMAGPLSGTGYPGSACFAVATKSPLTNLWTDGSSAGVWGAELRQTGYDGLIVEGASARPVYLWVTDGGAEIRDAGHLWGQDALAVQGSIREELREREARVAAIGPAGEKQVLVANIVNDDGRTTGRGGAGAVMGAKGLKAIAVKGARSVSIAGDAAWAQHLSGRNRMATALGAGPVGKYGTANALDTAWVGGDIPLQNWRKGAWTQGCIDIGGKRMIDTIVEPRDICAGCPVKCTRWVRIKDGRFAMEGPGPEYEALATFGAMCLNDNLESICALNDMCNRFGLDAVSTGSAVAFALEAYERGILIRGDAGGLDLSWGNADAMLELTKQIGEGSGLGKLLGQGVKRAAQEVGKDSAAFAVHVKGLEVAPHDPRAYFATAISHATGPSVSCDLHGLAMLYESSLINPEAGIFYRLNRFSQKGKGLVAKVAQDMSAVLDSMPICFYSVMSTLPRNLTESLGLFSGFPYQLAEALSLVTGYPYSSAEVMAAGERIVNLQRAFNLRCGLDPADDKLPARLLEATSEGSHAGKVPAVAEGVAEYYSRRGWTPDGRPTPEKLSALGLGFAIEQL